MKNSYIKKYIVMIKFYFHTSILFTFFIFFSCSANAEIVPKVLIINSYHYGFKWTDLVMEGIRDELGESESNIEYYVEYMDAKRSSAYSDDFLYDRLSKLYKDIDFNLIIISDDRALDFISRYRKRLFINIPVVFCGINDFKSSSIEGIENITGIAENVNIKSNIDLILRLFPNTKNIFSVSDGSETSLANLRRLQRNYPHYKSRLNFIEYHSLSSDSLLERLRSLPRDSVVLHLGYFSDTAGSMFSAGESVRMVAEASPVPVFGMWDWMFGYGIFGGVLTSGYEQGRSAGQLARRILDGESASSIPVVLESPTSTMFDYRQLTRFRYSSSWLPVDAEVRFEPESGLYRYRSVVWTATAVFACMLFVITILVFNIRARLRAEKTLRSSREFLDRIIDSISDPVFVKDERRRYIHVNQAFCEYTHLDRDDILGKNDSEICFENVSGYVGVHDESVISTGVERILENSVFNNDGSQSIFVTKKNRFVDGVGNYYIVGVSMDVTDIRNAEIRSKEACEISEQANRAKSEFLANMSHELRTPLNGALGMLQVLMETDINEEQMQYIVLAQNSCNNLVKIISDILDLSKIESGTYKVVSESFNLNEFVTDVQAAVSISTVSNSHALQFDVASDLPNIVVGDQLRLRQILFNLIGNASKFTSDGAVRVSIDQIPSANGRFIFWFCVEDSGIGIPEEKIDTIFDPFVQADGSSTRRYGGVGLGLSIVRRLVCLLDGFIELQSTVGKGTSFEVAIPMSCGCAFLPETPETEEEQAYALPARVLIADDDPVGRLAASAMIRKMGVECDVAENGLEAVDACASSWYDCILMDMQMPGLDGLQAARRIHGLRDDLGLPRIPVVVLTAHAMHGDRERFLENGMDGYLAKPVRFEDLKKALHEVAKGRLGQHHQERKVASPVVEVKDIVQ